MVLVGEDPASQVYVRNKGEQTEGGRHGDFEHKLPADDQRRPSCSALVDKLNADPAVHGILVQLPLPKQIDPQAVIDAIDPDKDVDGFHVVNAGRLATGGEGSGALHAARLPDAAEGSRSAISPASDAVVIGRSNIVGKPMAQLLLHENCTVTIAHSQTQDLPAWCRRADILVAAVGRPEMVQGRLDQAGRHGHRCRHQPHRAATARRGWSAMSTSPSAARSPARSRRCRAASGR